MQSILKARSVIADGMMWLIGDEKSVRTFYEKENRVKAVFLMYLPQGISGTMYGSFEF